MPVLGETLSIFNIIIGPFYPRKMFGCLRVKTKTKQNPNKKNFWI